MNDHTSRDCGCNVLTGRCFKHGWPLLIVWAICAAYPFVAFAFMVWQHGGAK